MLISSFWSSFRCQLYGPSNNSWIVNRWWVLWGHRYTDFKSIPLNVQSPFSTFSSGQLLATPTSYETYEFRLTIACKTKRNRSYYQLTDRTSLVGCYCCGWLNGQTNQWQNQRDPIRTSIYTWCRRHAFTVLLVGGYYKAYTTHSRMHTTRAHPHKTKTEQIRTTATPTTKTLVHEMKLFNKTERKRKIKWNKWLSKRKRTEKKEKSQL